MEYNSFLSFDYTRHFLKKEKVSFFLGGGGWFTYICIILQKQSTHAANLCGMTKRHISTDGTIIHKVVVFCGGHTEGMKICSMVKICSKFHQQLRWHQCKKIFAFFSIPGFNPFHNMHVYRVSIIKRPFYYLSIDETIALKAVKFYRGHNKGMGICLSEEK